MILNQPVNNWNSIFDNETTSVKTFRLIVQCLKHTFDSVYVLIRRIASVLTDPSFVCRRIPHSSAHGSLIHLSSATDLRILRSSYQYEDKTLEFGDLKSWERGSVSCHVVSCHAVTRAFYIFDYYEYHYSNRKYLNGVVMKGNNNYGTNL